MAFDERYLLSVIVGKLIGGLAKGHPDADEIRKAVTFYEEITNKMISE